MDCIAGLFRLCKENTCALLLQPGRCMFVCCVCPFGVGPSGLPCKTAAAACPSGFSFGAALCRTCARLLYQFHFRLRTLARRWGQRCVCLGAVVCPLSAVHIPWRAAHNRCCVFLLWAQSPCVGLGRGLVWVCVVSGCVWGGFGVNRASGVRVRIGDCMASGLCDCAGCTAGASAVLPY
jgi:hypothetical protein